MSVLNRVVTSLLILILSPLTAQAAIAGETDKQDTGATEEKLFATVNQDRITLAEYAQALNAGYRETFYHGRPPEGELEEFQLEVGQRLIDEQLLLQEAKRLGLQPDRDWVEKRVKARVEKASQHPRWEEQKERVLTRLNKEFDRENLLLQVNDRLKQVVAPNSEQLSRYYQANQDKFTTPARNRISIILLKVQPWDPDDVWEQTLSEGKKLAFQLAEGADFAELAEAFSQHPSADQGGDMGFLHLGMLGEAEQEIVSKMAVGDISDAIRVLEGVAIIRLTDREQPVLNPLEKVKERATGLWITEQQESVYQEAIEQLRRNAQIDVVASQFLDLPGATKRGWVPKKK